MIGACSADRPLSRRHQAASRGPRPDDHVDPDDPDDGRTVADAAARPALHPDLRPVSVADAGCWRTARRPRRVASGTAACRAPAARSPSTRSRSPTTSGPSCRARSWRFATRRDHGAGRPVGRRQVDDRRPAGRPLPADRRAPCAIDGIDLREIDSAAWRKDIGYVPQEVLLFHDTYPQQCDPIRGRLLRRVT